MRDKTKTMSKVSRLLSFGLLVASSAPACAVTQSEGQGAEVAVDGGQRPQHVVRTYQGTCGHDLFFISITPEAGPAPRALTSIRVNGNEIPASEAATLRSGLPGAKRIVEAVFDRCETRGARGRLGLVDPARNYQLQLFYFWISPDGHISDLRPN